MGAVGLKKSARKTYNLHSVRQWQQHPINDSALVKSSRRTAGRPLETEPLFFHKKVMDKFSGKAYQGGKVGDSSFKELCCFGCFLWVPRLLLKVQN